MNFSRGTTLLRPRKRASQPYVPALPVTGHTAARLHFRLRAKLRIHIRMPLRAGFHLSRLSLALDASYSILHCIINHYRGFFISVKQISVKILSEQVGFQRFGR